MFSRIISRSGERVFCSSAQPARERLENGLGRRRLERVAQTLCANSAEPDSCRSNSQASFLTLLLGVCVGGRRRHGLFSPTLVSS